MSSLNQVPELFDGNYWYVCRVDEVTLADPELYFPQGAGGAWNAQVGNEVYQISCSPVCDLSLPQPESSASHNTVIEALPVSQRPYNRAPQ